MTTARTETGRKRSRLLLLGTIALLLPVSLAGCSSETSAAIAVGDCLAEADAGSSSPRIVNCDQPHRAQVVGVYVPVGGPYPGADVLASEAQQYCSEAFAEFVGSDPFTSVLDLYPLLPTERAWDEGETQVICIAATFNDVSVRHSFQDSHR